MKYQVFTAVGFANALLAVVVSVMFNPSLVAQTEEYTCRLEYRLPTPAISVGGGYNRGDARLEFETMDSLRHNNIFENGINQVSGFVELLVPLCMSCDLSVAGRISWTDAKVNFQVPYIEYGPLIPGSLEPVSLPATEGISFTTQQIRLDVTGNMLLVDRLRLGIGASVAYRIVSHYAYSQQLDLTNMRSFNSPSTDLSIIGHSPLAIHIDGNDKGYSHLSLGALIIAGYEFPLTHRLSFIPELELRGDFTSPFPDTKWHVLSAGGAISLKYSL